MVVTVFRPCRYLDYIPLRVTCNNVTKKSHPPKRGIGSFRRPNPGSGLTPADGKVLKYDGYDISKGRVRIRIMCIYPVSSHLNTDASFTEPEKHHSILPIFSHLPPYLIPRAQTSTILPYYYEDWYLPIILLTLGIK